MRTSHCLTDSRKLPKLRLSNICTLAEFDCAINGLGLVYNSRRFRHRLTRNLLRDRLRSSRLARPPVAVPLSRSSAVAMVPAGASAKNARRRPRDWRSSAASLPPTRPQRRRPLRPRPCIACCRPRLRLAIPLLALGLYLKVGHPGLPAAPFVAGAKPPAEQPMDIAQLVAQARARVAAEPNNADAQSALGEALTLEADGTVTPAAVEAFKQGTRPAAGRCALSLLSRPARRAGGRQRRRPQALAGARSQKPAQRALPARAARRDGARCPGSGPARQHDDAAALARAAGGDGRR